jgi:hypothetical protein
VNEDFDHLFEFLQHHDYEVIGHAAVSAVTRQRLAKLAAGQCTEPEREEMKRLLEAQPELISVLAEEVRSLRKATR